MRPDAMILSIRAIRSSGCRHRPLGAVQAPDPRDLSPLRPGTGPSVANAPAAGGTQTTPKTIHGALMKRTSLFAALLALGGIAAGDAVAYSPYTCTLDVVVPSGYNPVPVGQQYGFRVQISFVDFGPPPPVTYEPFQVVYHGTRNGVNDTGSGQYLHNAPGNYPKTVMAYNPGGVAGNYVRYALIYRNGQFICSTNSVYVGLQ